jgi:environmental stress-induced protein Ves
MVISVDGQPHRLDLFDVLAFPGDAPCVGTLVDGPTRDLNVMTRRHLASADVGIVSVDGRHSLHTDQGSESLVVALAGSLSIGTPDQAIPLDRLDAVRLSGPATVDLTGTGRIAVIHLRA